VFPGYRFLLAALSLILLAGARDMRAQGPGDPSIAEMSMTDASDRSDSATLFRSDRAGDLVPAPALMPAPLPGDVLTPDSRSNSPNLKVGVRLGFNRAAYTNDRYLDNHPFDVGNVYGEEDVYGSAAGFGWSAGVDVEIPRNGFFSWVLGLDFQHATFDNGGTVQDICYSADGDSIGMSSEHDFSVNIDYLRASGAAKLDFQRFYLMLGLTAGVPIANGVRFSRLTADGTPCFYPEANDIRNSRDEVAIPEIRHVHFGLRFGGGITFDLTESIQFSPEILFDFGMNAINKSPESDLGIYAVSGVFRFEL
jgi:hypothetical protein